MNISKESGKVKRKQTHVNRKKEDLLPVEKLRKLLHYCPHTGVFIRRVTTSWMALEGSRAGGYSNGYRVIVINYKVYLEHRLAILYMTGRWPHNLVDHINGVRDDNRFSNLRECSQAENKRNQTQQRNSTSGVKGVFFNKRTNKWYVQICLNRKNLCFGSFTDKEDAIRVAREKREELHGEFCNHGDMTLSN